MVRMRVFVAGATGAIGKALVPRLIAAGHQVTGLTRSEAKAPSIRAMGAEAVIGNVFDADRLNEIVCAAHPEVLIHELTDLPQEFDLAKIRRSYPENNLVRREGTKNLVAAAKASGVRRFLVESMASWYDPKGGGLKTENDPLDLYADEPVGTAVRALDFMEQTVLNSGMEAVVLRYGALYGPGTWFGKGGGAWKQVLERRFPIIGDGAGMYSWIHVDDAASATVALAERGAPGIYNVVDNDASPVKIWLPVYAQALRAKPPYRVPVWIASLIAGRGLVKWMRTMPGALNRKLRNEVGWNPAYPSWRQGFFGGLK
jgi:nucleoside-diphosphate-sugar epimerase